MDPNLEALVMVNGTLNITSPSDMTLSRFQVNHVDGTFDPEKGLWEQRSTIWISAILSALRKVS